MRKDKGALTFQICCILDDIVRPGKLKTSSHHFSQTYITDVNQCKFAKSKPDWIFVATKNRFANSESCTRVTIDRKFEENIPSCSQTSGLCSLFKTPLLLYHKWVTKVWYSTPAQVATRMQFSTRLILLARATSTLSPPLRLGKYYAESLFTVSPFPS